MLLSQIARHLLMMAAEEALLAILQQEASLPRLVARLSHKGLNERCPYSLLLLRMRLVRVLRVGLGVRLILLHLNFSVVPKLHRGD